MCRKQSQEAEYVNRKDERYYLHVGKTKTGKPKYFCSRKPSEAPPERMPEGFEWRENPENGTVSVRKTRPTPIAPFEREQVIDGLHQQADLPHFIVDIVDDSLVLYLPDMDVEGAMQFVGKLVGASTGDRRMASMRDWTLKQTRYSPMMRFVLHDPDERLYVAERWCFLGAIDDWITLSGPAPLATHIGRYAEHLGKETFYELM